MADPIQFIMVGCGGIANSWLEQVFTNPDIKDDVELVAVCDPIPSRFKKLEKFGYEDVPTYSDVANAFVDGVWADAALILTPPQYHPRYIRECVRNDLHVITEKSFLTNMNQYRAMRNLIPMMEEMDLIGVVNQQYRWNPRNQAIKLALNEGKIGEIGWVRSNFTQNRYHFNDWWRSMHEDISQFNWFIHHYDNMRFYLDSNPKTVRARLTSVPWSKIYGESTIFLDVEFENGVNWSYIATQEGVAAFEDSGQTSFTIYGSKGAIRNTKNKPPELRVEGSDPHNPDVEFLGEMTEADEISTDSSKKKYPPGWDITMKHFIKAVRSDGEYKHPTRFQDNFYTIAIPLCARESQRRNGAPVDVKEYLGLD